MTDANTYSKCLADESRRVIKQCKEHGVDGDIDAVFIVVAATQLRLAINVEAYEYTSLAQSGTGLRLVLHGPEDSAPQYGVRRQNGILVAPGNRVEVDLFADKDDVGVSP